MDLDREPTDGRSLSLLFKKNKYIFKWGALFLIAVILQELLQKYVPEEEMRNDTTFAWHPTSPFSHLSHSKSYY